MLRRYIPDFSKHEAFLENDKWVAELIADNRLEIACKRVETFGADGGSYSNIDKAFKNFEKIVKV